MKTLTQCSAQAGAMIRSTEDNVGTTQDKPSALVKYPFRSMLIGQAFAVAFEEASESAVRQSASLASRKLGKKFAVIKHDVSTLYEVARIA